MIKNSDGTKTYSYTSGGMVTTTTVDENGIVLSKETKPFEKTSYTRDDGAVVTQESPLSKAVDKGTGKVTTYTFNDGEQYTGKETNWLDAQAKTGNTSGLATAISYPDYVDSNEAWRFLNEQADMYGVNLNNPNPTTNAYTKEEGVNIIPNFSLNGGNAVNPTVSASAKSNFDLGSYFDSAKNNISKSFQASKNVADEYYNSLSADEKEAYKKRQQEAYIANRLGTKKTMDSLMEQGVKGGLTESSLIKSQADFENNYNANLSDHVSNLTNIERERAKAYAQLESELNKYFAQIDMEEAEAMERQYEYENDYALDAYLAQLEREELAFKKQEADRDYYLSLQGK